jgi:RND superfamily putative drug exporter
MVLVPAVIESLGKSAWWFPKWLEWLLKLNIEGSPELLEAEQDMKPTADASTAVNA